jgi:DNA-binding transcriptional ArsR family regulator
MSQRTRRAPDPASFEGLAPVFAALGDETRLKLVGALCVGGAMSITQLTAGTLHTRQAVTKHLAVLAAVGLVLVRDTRAGRERLWEFAPGAIEEARRTLEVIAAQWDGALESLRRVVEQ